MSDVNAYKEINPTSPLGAHCVNVKFVRDMKKHTNAPQQNVSTFLTNSERLA
jgi:hypothetical protein